MSQTPRRSVSPPGAGGALRVRPRGSNGRFVKAEPATPHPPYPDQGAALQTTPDVDAKPDGGLPNFRPRSPAASPAQLVTRVTRAIERELEEIEGIVGGPRSEADKRARTLASLARTLAEVTRLKEAAREARGAARKEAKADHDHDALPRDLDEFRRTLERRLAQLADAGEISLAGGDEPG